MANVDAVDGAETGQVQGQRGQRKAQRRAGGNAGQRQSVPVNIRIVLAHQCHDRPIPQVLHSHDLDVGSVPTVLRVRQRDNVQGLNVPLLHVRHVPDAHRSRGSVPQMPQLQLEQPMGADWIRLAVQGVLRFARLAVARDGGRVLVHHVVRKPVVFLALRKTGRELVDARFDRLPRLVLADFPNVLLGYRQARSPQHVGAVLDKPLVLVPPAVSHARANLVVNIRHVGSDFDFQVATVARNRVNAIRSLRRKPLVIPLKRSRLRPSSARFRVHHAVRARVKLAIRSQSVGRRSETVAVRDRFLAMIVSGFVRDRVD